MAVASSRKWTFHPTAARKSLTGPGARGQNGPVRNSRAAVLRCARARGGWAKLSGE